MIPDNLDIYEAHERQRLSRPHIEDETGEPIYEGDKYVVIESLGLYREDVILSMMQEYEAPDEF